MSFQIHTPQTAPPESRQTLSTMQERYGFIPNLAAVFAESPGAFKGLLGALQAYDDESLTLAPLERQIVQIAVAVENRCDYCAAAHSTLANKLGLDAKEIDRLQQQRRLRDQRLEALRSFTTDVVRQRGRLDQASIDNFLIAGFTKAQVLEVLLGVAIKTLTNYADHIARPPVNEEFSQFIPIWDNVTDE